MDYDPDSASKQLERMYHARMIGFNEYRLGHQMIWYMYGDFEGEKHVCAIKDHSRFNANDGAGTVYTLG